MEKRIQYSWEDLSNDPIDCFATPHFSFVMDLKCQKVLFHETFSKYLGFEKKLVQYKDFIKAIPREEYSKLIRVHRLFHSFCHTYRDISQSIRFVLVHSLKRKNNSPMRVVREVYFLPSKEEKINAYCVNKCTDITNIPIEEGVQFDITLPPRLQHRRELIMQLFAPVLGNNAVCFSNRELEVLKRWRETDNIDLAASSLSISARTLETHLRNMRKKIGVRRTVDVMIYAKERGWI